MVNVEIVGGADIELLVDAHAAEVVQHRHQQILHRQVAVVAEQHDTAVGKGVFRQLVAQASGRRPAEGEEIVVALALLAQRVCQLALFVKQTVGFIFCTVDPVQLGHHLYNGGRRLQ